jgi:hypothetical protein
MSFISDARKQPGGWASHASRRPSRAGPELGQGSEFGQRPLCLLGRLEIVPQEMV